LLFIPPLRLLIAKWVIEKFKNSKNIHVQTSGPGSGNPASSSSSPVIEGEFTVAEDDDDNADEGPDRLKSSKNNDKSDSPWRQ
jgi:UPF0716 family protein affecting phage T7 exclusion